ncbi:helix-turn-helix domain-containing protein [Thalassobacillus devorans]|uniref:helix-turn-helix domain-containing protein n=1 Tax=Thalassobacillus devorans TaxID=279813 RepID=UPI00048CFB06|nr:helix-turn-helix domain-containing protein [Thalassobacillus devorans]
MGHENDYRIHLQEVDVLHPRINQGVLLMLVINGELSVETNSRFYKLEERDLLVINQNQLYQIKGSSNNRVLTVTITSAYMNKYYPAYKDYRFSCYSKEIDMGREPLVKTIRKLLAEMLISNYRKSDSYRIEMQANLSEILLVLARSFKQKAIRTEAHLSNESRINEIIRFMEENYKQPITLSDTADHFYLSPGYLSRYFKQKMDIGFNRFLNEIRLNHAVKDLLYTPHTIEQIAIDNGFSSAKSFSQLFQKMYQQTPNVYREKNRKDTEDLIKSYHLENVGKAPQFQNILQKLQRFLNEDVTSSFVNTEWGADELTIDAASDPLNQELNFPKHTLSIGELSEVLREDVRSQLVMTKKELGLDYIGVQRLIKGSIIAPAVETDEVIATTSPFYNADAALNFLQKHGFSLFIRIEYKEVTEDEETYFRALRQFLKHSLNVYGNAFVSSWRFLFYEPFHTAVSYEELRRVYVKLYQAIKELVPNTQAGVFLPFSYKEGRPPETHETMLEEQVPIDFIGYESNQNEMIDFEHFEDERFALSSSFIKDKTKMVKTYVRKHYQNMPIHLINWNTLTGNTRYTNGTFFRGALVLKSAMEIASEVESIGFWINTEQHEKRDKNRRISLDGMELFHYFSGKRPVYFAMQLLKRLEGRVISIGNEYVMTKTDGGYQLILLNYNTVNPYYSTQESLSDKLNKDFHVTITNLEPGEYQIRKRVFDKDHGALYSKWRSLNSKFGIDEEVIRYITETSQPSLEIFDEVFEGEWSFYSFLSFNAIHFFEIRKIIT